ncbi:MAG: hypothetical protein ACKOBW_02010, partial [Planctomycetota bacterium]
MGDLTGRAPQLFAQVPGYSSPERFPQPVSGGPVVTAAPPTAPDNFGAPGAGSGLIPGPNPGTGVPATDPNWNLPAAPPSYGGLPEPPTAQYIPENRYADLDAIVRETQTGRFQFGVGVNSDAGVTGQIVIDERNFDWQRLPTSGSDVLNGTGFRGAGQGFRIEAMPGNQVQR